MSYWDGHAVIKIPPKIIDGYPKWLDVDCGCCAGLEWGGEYPRECSFCKGAGWYAVHISTGTCAMYPGGPLLGARHTKEEVAILMAAKDGYDGYFI